MWCPFYNIEYFNHRVGPSRVLHLLKKVGTGVSRRYTVPVSFVDVFSLRSPLVSINLFRPSMTYLRWCDSLSFSFWSEVFITANEIVFCQNTHPCFSWRCWSNSTRLSVPSLPRYLSPLIISYSVFLLYSRYCRFTLFFYSYLKVDHSDPFSSMIS